MDILKTKQGIDVKILWNQMDCPYSGNCPEQEKREKTLLMHRCSYNPSIFECEEYQRRECPSKLNPEKIYDLDCL